MVANVAVESPGGQSVSYHVLTTLLKAKCPLAKGYSLCLLVVPLELQLNKCNVQSQVPSIQSEVLFV